jgi:hypothetical protein
MRVLSMHRSHQMACDGRVTTARLGSVARLELRKSEPSTKRGITSRTSYGSRSSAGTPPSNSAPSKRSGLLSRNSESNRHTSCRRAGGVAARACLPCGSPCSSCVSAGVPSNACAEGWIDAAATAASEATGGASPRAVAPAPGPFAARRCPAPRGPLPERHAGYPGRPDRFRLVFDQNSETAPHQLQGGKRMMTSSGSSMS